MRLSFSVVALQSTSITTWFPLLRKGIANESNIVMIRLLFVIPEYSHGGTNKSLENLLSLIDKTKYQISVYCLYEDGGDYYKNEFSPYILKKSQLYYWMHDNVVTRKVMGLYNMLTKRQNFKWLYQREVRYLQRKYDFDTVIAYQEGNATMFVSFFANITKIAWIQFDYAMINNKADLRLAKQYYDKYHRIVCVSEAAMKSMLSVYPEYTDKATYIYNTVNTIFITEQAEDKSIEVPYLKGVFNILSVGRFVGLKNFHQIPIMASRIMEMTQKPFCWYIMGEGEYLGEIERSIKEYNVANYVKLIKAQENPYPFFKQADLHVCLSDYESFSYTLAEAKTLHTPVLSNDFPVAYEVVDSSTGWIANLKDMMQLLARVIDNEGGEYERKKASIMNYQYFNKAILQKFEGLLQ